MATSKAKASSARRVGARDVQKQMLLPLPAAHVKDLSLAAHVALATCRIGKGNRYQLYELVRSTYLSYFLWKSGWGSAEYSLYCAAEGLLEASAEVGEKTDDWMLNAEAAALMEVILRTFDNQIATVQGGVYAKCRAKLDLLIRVDLPGRFEPDVLADHS